MSDLHSVGSELDETGVRALPHPLHEAREFRVLGCERAMIERDRSQRPKTRKDYLGVDANEVLLPSSLDLTYEEVPYYYTWSANKTWKRRVRPHFQVPHQGGCTSM